MLSRMRLSLIVPVLLGFGQVLYAGTAVAAVACPPTSGGHHLRRMGGGSLYLGRPQDNMVQAPASTQGGANGYVNTWRFSNAENLTLICRYEGTQAAVTLPLSAGSRTCRQEAASSIFVCQ